MDDLVSETETWRKRVVTPRGGRNASHRRLRNGDAMVVKTSTRNVVFSKKKRKGKREGFGGHGWRREVAVNPLPASPCQKCPSLRRIGR